MDRRAGVQEAKPRRGVGAPTLWLCLIGTVLLARAAHAVPTEPEFSKWLIMPGHEAAVTGLLGSYWQAAQPPSLANAVIRQTVVEIEADSGAGKGKFILRHDTDASTAGGDLVKGGAAHIDIDIQCPACTAAGKANLHAVATAILADPKATATSIWSVNPDKGRPSKPREVRHSHVKMRLLIVLGGLVVALFAGVVIARSRRRKAEAPVPQVAAPAADAPDATVPPAAQDSPDRPD